MLKTKKKFQNTKKSKKNNYLQRIPPNLTPPKKKSVFTAYQSCDPVHEQVQSKKSYVDRFTWAGYGHWWKCDWRSFEGFSFLYCYAATFGKPRFSHFRLFWVVLIWAEVDWIVWLIELWLVELCDRGSWLFNWIMWLFDSESWLNFVIVW